MGEIEIRGYAVRYTNARGTFYVLAPKWLEEYTIGTSPEDDGALFETFGEAVAATRHPRRGTDVSIFRVFADGREERLPSLEEALAEIERLRGVAPILLEGVPAIMHSSAPSSREEIGAAACEMLKAIERALSVLRGSEPVDPLAALEAAEQRLLEAEGWTQEPGEPTLWRSSTGHPWGPRRRLVSRDEAVSLARRAAKKGGS